MSLNGPRRTQPPPEPRSMVTALLDKLCSSGLYSPSPERDVSLPSKRGLSWRLPDQSGQFQYLAVDERVFVYLESFIMKD